jgi:hypothetical protein
MTSMPFPGNTLMAPMASSSRTTISRADSHQISALLLLCWIVACTSSPYHPTHSTND